MKWYHSDLTAHGSTRALHYGHPGKMPQLVVGASAFVGMLDIGSDGRAAVVDLAELATWCLLFRVPAPSEADLAWLVGNGG